MTGVQTCALPICRIRIQLHADGQRLRVRVIDNGIGTPVPRPEGMGLHIMEYRARMIGGLLTLSPGPGGGTVLTCSIPEFGEES